MTQQQEAHSETHLTESREYWWNKDYLQLLAERLNLSTCINLADIGCGHGLMAFLLAPYLPENAIVNGIDLEIKYVKKAKQKAKKFNKDSQVAFYFHIDLVTFTRDRVMRLRSRNPPYFAGAVIFVEKRLRLLVS